MFLIYDLIFIFFAVLYFPYVLIKKKIHKDFLMRCGIFSKSFLEELKKNNNIWIHAVSVGEVLAVLNLIQMIKEKFPNNRIVCSTVTITGNDLAKSKLSKGDLVIYSPLDFSLTVKRFVRFINPKIYISTETELWPNLYKCLCNNNVPILQINGRISDESFKWYKRFSFLTKDVLSNVSIFCMQSELYKERIIELGADKEKVKMVGNIKFDSVNVSKQYSLKDLGYKKTDQIFLAGSTHLGEEEIVLDLFENLSAEFNNLRLIIVPRHIERSKDVINYVQKKGFRAIEYSKLNDSEIDDKTIVVVDTIGHLSSLYSIAKVVFIGKTLTGKGGQNMIEPVAYGKATFVGPHTQNFKDVMNIFLDGNAIVQVKDEGELYKQIREFLNNSDKFKILEENTKKVIDRNKGATLRTLEYVEELLK